MKKRKSTWEQLKKGLWEKNSSYFNRSRESLRKDFMRHPGLVKIKEYSLKAEKILDGGCGDGTLLELIWRNDGLFFGADASSLAIKLGKKRLKKKSNITLEMANLEALPFEDGFFDLVYSAFVFEHLRNPEKAIEEIIRVTQKKGVLIFLSPNFGCPHWTSPSVSRQPFFLFKRALKLFLKSHRWLFFKPDSLEWEKVYPLALKQKEWQPDWDTLCEPYLGTLLPFLEKRKVKIIFTSSGWQWQKEALVSQPGVWGLIFNQLRVGFKFLGELGIPPYKFYGPTLFVVGKKTLD